MSDSINTGNIEGSKGVVVGSGQVHYEEHHHYPAPDTEKPTFPIHQIAHPQNPNFTGREQILQQVAAALSAGQTTVVTQTIAGLGGVGKTQLALAYSYAHRGSYDLIYWLSADSEPGLGEGLMSLARRLKLIAPEAADQQAAVHAVQHWLGQTSHKWLLVYDNADIIEPGQLTNYLPRSGNGHVLITSRNPNYGGVGQVLELGLFALDEAVRFLFRRKEAKGEKVERGSKAWQEAAALAQIVADELALDDALGALRRYSLMQRTDDELNMHRLVQAVARSRMDEKMRQNWLEAALELVLKSWPFQQNKMETWEESKALLPQLISVADLAHAQNFETERAATLNGHIVFYMNFFGNNRAALPFSRRALAIREKALGPDHPDTARSLNNLGALLQAMGDLVGARPFYERALVIYEKALGPDHPDTALSLNNLGALLRAMGDLPAARPFYERALAIREKALGPDHPDTASSLNNLGSLLQAMGDLAAARPYLERALAINEKALGPDHPDTASSLNNLGALLRAMGDLAGARPFYERALAINEKALGPDHPDLAYSLNNLGLLADAEGDLPAARDYLARALAIFEKALGPNHPNSNVVRNNLAAIEADISS